MFIHNKKNKKIVDHINRLYSYLPAQMIEKDTQYPTKKPATSTVKQSKHIYPTVKKTRLKLNRYFLISYTVESLYYVHLY